MDSREQFEAHYDDWSGRPGYAKECRMGDTYSWPRMSQAWFHWQAARAAVVVELPKQFGPNRLVTKAEIHTRQAALHECHRAIEAAGVKVAP